MLLCSDDNESNSIMFAACNRYCIILINLMKRICFVQIIVYDILCTQTNKICTMAK